jgi:hypothetical protein
MTRFFAAFAMMGAGAAMMATVMLGACSSGGGRQPTARIALSPEYVPINDGYATEVTADGTASSDAIDDPAASHPLSFAWTVDDPNAHFSPDDHSAKVTVKIGGAHPAAVHLTVRDFDGDEGSASATIGVTVP